MDLELELEHFLPLVGDTFVADFGEHGSLDLVLTEAEEKPTGTDEATAFALLFRGPSDLVFDQGLISIEHATLGTHGIFLVPVGENESGRVYEAVFTRNRS